MNNFISKENMERQISEMWDALHQLPTNEPDRDFAYEQGNNIEKKLREQYRKQEQLRNAAPELLEACMEAKTMIYNICNGMEQRSPEVLQSILDVAIKKATE